jgi:hypothetical protein
MYTISGPISGFDFMATIQEVHRMLSAIYSVQEDTVLLDAVSTKSERDYHHLQFENDVSQGYGCINLITHPHKLRCIVTNQFHSQKDVCKGAHIIAVSEKRALFQIGLENSAVWDERNGLCVLRSIDQRFESKELVSCCNLLLSNYYVVYLLNIISFGGFTGVYAQFRSA